VDDADRVLSLRVVQRQDADTRPGPRGAAWYDARAEAEPDEANDGLGRAELKRSSVGMLTVRRFLQGAAGGGGIVTARAVAADLTSRRVLGGLVLAWSGSWRPMFLVLAAISLVLAAATWASIPESSASEQRHTGGLRQTCRAFAGRSATGSSSATP
jgi:MFS family permease